MAQLIDDLLSWAKSRKRSEEERNRIIKDQMELVRRLKEMTNKEVIIRRQNVD